MPHTIQTSAGVTMPKLIYGTAWKKDRTKELVMTALRCGFRGIDTACQPKHYNEAGVGEALKTVAAEGISRESIFLQTKFTPLEGQDPNNIPYDKNASLEIQVKQSFSTSLKNLQTDYVDSYVLHSPLFPYVNLLKVWHSMEEIASSGSAKQLGISNCYDLKVLERLYTDATVKPSVLQNRFYSDSGYDTEIRAFCDANEIYYQSFWSLTANPHILGSEPLLRAAIKRGVEPPQIFYAYLMAKNIVPLNGTTSFKHMQEDLAVFDLSLTVEEITAIDKLLV